MILQQEHQPEQQLPEPLCAIAPSHNVDSKALTSQEQEQQQEKEPGLIVGLRGGQTKEEIMMNTHNSIFIFLPNVCLECVETSVVCVCLCVFSFIIFCCSWFIV